MGKKNLTDESMVKIYNNTFGSASFFGTDGRRYKFPKYKSSRMVALSVVQDLYNDYPNSIESGIFVLSDKDVYDYIGVDKEVVDKILTDAEIDELLEKDVKDLEKELKELPDVIQENVAKRAKSKDLDSTKARKTIKNVTGFDLDESIE